jgi:capsid assembly protease
VTNLPLLFSRIFGAPLAIHPSKFEAILGGIGDRLGLELTEDQIQAAANSPKTQAKGYAVQDGIAVIPISGSLMKKTSGLMAASGSSSYETIGAQFQDAIKNPTIKGILLDIDSPGGETSGLFELADLMDRFKSVKPIYGISNDAAFSAAYALASVADKLYLTQTAGVGSIGVFCAHVDQSGADAKAGMKYTFIHAGAKKVDGNPHEPLSNSALNDTQTEVNRQYGMFVSLVALNRNMSEDAVKATEAGVYFGDNAVKAGLADKVGTLEDAFNDLQAHINTDVPKNQKGGHAANLNNHSAQNAPVLKAEVTDELMAKKIAELDIDELVATHAAKKANDEYTKKEEEADDEEMKGKGKKADAEDGDDDKKKKDDEDEEDDEACESKKAKASYGDATRIVNLCTLAGMPALASEFLVSGYTVAQVEAALLKGRATKSKSVKIASSNVSPANELVSTAKAIATNASIDKNKKADAYREFLMAHPEQYLQTMLTRNTGNKSGEDYKFLKNRGY